MGNPFLLATDFQPTVTYGIVSGVHRYQYPAGTLLEYADCLQTDASINPGNSGGPLFDAAGPADRHQRPRLVRETRPGERRRRLRHLDQPDQELPRLPAQRPDRRPRHARRAVARRRRRPRRRHRHPRTSDAYRRGLRYGDEIVSFGGRPIATPNGFKNVLGIFPKGWRVPLSYRREGERRDVFVRLMGVHTDEELLRKAEGALPVEEQAHAQAAAQGRCAGRQPSRRRSRTTDKARKPPKIQPQARTVRKMPLDRVHSQQPPPKHVEKWIAKRPGYANYYFNEQNRDRVWNALLAHGDFSGLTGVWKLTGSDAAANKIEIELAGEKVTGRFGTKPVEVDLARDLDGQLAPEGSGGLLVALHLWQRLLRLGPKQFGDVYYLGTAPVPDRPGLYDVLVATHDVVEARFLFDPATGHLIGLEMFPDDQVDPCEVYFDDYRPWTAASAARIAVRHGDAVFGQFKLESITLSK